MCFPPVSLAMHSITRSNQAVGGRVSESTKSIKGLAHGARIPFRIPRVIDRNASRIQCKSSNANRNAVSGRAASRQIGDQQLRRLSHSARAANGLWAIIMLSFRLSIGAFRPAARGNSHRRGILSILHAPLNAIGGAPFPVSRSSSFPRMSFRKQ